ncbi:MAG: FtsL-like putative cell division protein [Bacteroidia bacterium]
MSKPSNKLKYKAPLKEEEVVVEALPKENKVMRSIASVVSGNFLSQEITLKNLPFIFFLSFLAVCYIANGYYADDQVRKVNKLSNEIKELRTQYMVVKDSFIIKSKQTEIARVLAQQQTGIKESVVPPKKIIIKKITTQQKE